MIVERDDGPEPSRFGTLARQNTKRDHNINPCISSLIIPYPTLLVQDILVGIDVQTLAFSVLLAVQVLTS